MNYLVIPAFNEEKRIAKNLEAYAKKFSSWKIIVVVNGCTDDTIGVVKKVAKKYKNIDPVEVKEQAGKGGSVKIGFLKALEKARGKDLIGFVDADSSTAPTEFEKLVKAIEKTKSDVVIASRYSHGGNISPKQTKLRILASRLLNYTVRILFNLQYSDTQCGAKLFKSEALKKIVGNMREKNWMFDIEVLYLLKKAKKKIECVGINWKNDSRSHLSIKKVPNYFFDVLIIRMRL